MVILKYNNDLKKEIEKGKHPIIVLGGDEKINRLILENKKIDILLSPELNLREDSIKFRSSGLNQVLCKIASKNDVSIGFDFCLLIKSKGFERTRYLGRMIQNVILCRKYKTGMIFGCFGEEQRSEKTIKAFMNLLGIKPGEGKIYRKV